MKVKRDLNSREKKAGLMQALDRYPTNFLFPNLVEIFEKFDLPNFLYTRDF